MVKKYKSGSRYENTQVWATAVVLNAYACILLYLQQCQFVINYLLFIYGWFCCTVKYNVHF